MAIKSVELKKADVEELVDIRDVQIDSSLSTEDKIKSYVAQIRDPYCFKVGSVVVRVSYSDKQTTLNDQFVNMLSVM